MFLPHIFIFKYRRKPIRFSCTKYFGYVIIVEPRFPIYFKRCVETSFEHQSSSSDQDKKDRIEPAELSEFIPIPLWLSVVGNANELSPLRWIHPEN